MKNRIFSIVLAFVLCLFMSINVFAATPLEEDGATDSKDVTAGYVAGQASAPVYKVDISWGSMTFTYTAASTGTWNPSTHVYDGAVPAAWTFEENANKITVTNHSNAAVTAVITEENVTQGLTFSWDNDTLELATADNGENGAAGTPTTASALLTVSGTLTASEEPVTIGTVTVTLETE